MADELLQGPLSPLELRVYERLKIDFRPEITCIHWSLDTLRKAIDNLTDEIFVTHADLDALSSKISNEVKGPPSQWSRSDIFRQLLVDPQQLCSAVWLALCGEALERIIAGRLLLLTGHQSRTLSCIRDAYECLQYADVCRFCEKESEKWLKGKQVRVPRNFHFTPPLSEALFDLRPLNVWGTHAYYESTTLSLLPLAPFHPVTSELEIATRLYKTNTLASFGFIFDVTELFFAYIINVRPSLTHTIPEILPAYCSVQSILKRIVTALKDYQAESTAEGAP